jgi:hypothetical protein
MTFELRRVTRFMRQGYYRWRIFNTVVIGRPYTAPNNDNNTSRIRMLQYKYPIHLYN